MLVQVWFEVKVRAKEKTNERRTWCRRQKDTAWTFCTAQGNVRPALRNMARKIRAGEKVQNIQYHGRGLDAAMIQITAAFIHEDSVTSVVGVA